MITGVRGHPKVAYDQQGALLTTVFRSSSMGTSPDAVSIDQRLRSLVERRSLTFSPGSHEPPSPSSAHPLSERLYDVLAAMKVITAQVAMHIDSAWRHRLFRQLDELLDPGEFDCRDELARPDSFATFMRAMIHLRPLRSPGLGLSNSGNLVAAWTNGSNRLTIEFFPGDETRWVLSVIVDGERESAAGRTPLHRLEAVLAPYNPSQWFQDGKDVSPT